jgi:SAM-dependent methyltransferase
VTSKRAAVDANNRRKTEATGSHRSNGAGTKRPDHYQPAVATGWYGRDGGGLLGKYDNVRRYWENQATRYALHDFIGPLVARKRRSLSRIRVLDLGAGSGEGYEILASLKKPGDTWRSKEIDVMPSDILGFYKGLDISPAMVEQGRRTYDGFPKVHFEAADLSEGLGPARDDPPYDIYFSSYGSLSHLRDKELERLVTDLCAHLQGSAIFVADLLGRYSFEWQCYWNRPGVDESNMRQYSMSYLYPAEMLDQIEAERFPMRYWAAEEFDRFLTEAVNRAGAQVAKRQFRDRSVLVGRHMSTGEFNPQAQPIRDAVNRLHEINHRTDLSSLIFDYTATAGFEKLNAFFDRFQMAWNAVVYAAIEALDNWDQPDLLRQQPSKEYPKVVRESIRTIRDVVRNLHWFRMGDPRANVVEPQLGYILRNLEMDFQEGIGAAHGLLATYEIQKP